MHILYATKYKGMDTVYKLKRSNTPDTTCTVEYTYMYIVNKNLCGGRAAGYTVTTKHNTRIQ